jgi:hypothetical protein
MADKQTVTEVQVIAALQGIGQVLQQIAAELAALRVLLVAPVIENDGNF